MDYVKKVVKDLDSTLQFFNIPQSQRKRSQVEEFLSLIKDVPFFLKYIQSGCETICHQCLRYMYSVQYEEGQEIFAQGSIGEQFYVILEGKIGIYVNIAQDIEKRNLMNSNQVEANTPEIVVSKCVKVLESGDSFGELSLIYNKPRLAGAKAHQKSYLAVLNKKHFRQILKYEEESSLNREMQYFTTLPFFEGHDFNHIRDIYLNTFKLKTTKNEIIFHEGDQCDAVYIIKSGEFSIFRVFCHQEQFGEDDIVPSEIPEEISAFLRGKHNTQQDKRFKEISMTVLGSGELFGEENILMGEKRSFTVKCLSGQGELLMIKKEQFLNKIMSHASSSQFIKERCIHKKNNMTRIQENIETQMKAFASYFLGDERKIKLQHRLEALTNFDGLGQIRKRQGIYKQNEKDDQIEKQQAGNSQKQSQDGSLHQKHASISAKRQQSPPKDFKSQVQGKTTTKIETGLSNVAPPDRTQYIGSGYNIPQEFDENGIFEEYQPKKITTLTYIDYQPESKTNQGVNQSENNHFVGSMGAIPNTTTSNNNNNNDQKQQLLQQKLQAANKNDMLSFPIAQEIAKKRDILREYLRKTVTLQHLKDACFTGQASHEEVSNRLKKLRAKKQYIDYLKDFKEQAENNLQSNQQSLGTSRCDEEKEIQFKNILQRIKSASPQLRTNGFEGKEEIASNINGKNEKKMKKLYFREGVRLIDGKIKKSKKDESPELQGKSLNNSKEKQDNSIKPQSAKDESNNNSLQIVREILIGSLNPQQQSSSYQLNSQSNGGVSRNGLNFKQRLLSAQQSPTWQLPQSAPHTSRTERNTIIAPFSYSNLDSHFKDEQQQSKDIQVPIYYAQPPQSSRPLSYTEEHVSISSLQSPLQSHRHIPLGSPKSKAEINAISCNPNPNTNYDNNLTNYSPRYSQNISFFDKPASTVNTRNLINPSTKRAQSASVGLSTINSLTQLIKNDDNLALKNQATVYIQQQPPQIYNNSSSRSSFDHQAFVPKLMKRCSTASGNKKPSSSSSSSTILSKSKTIGINGGLFRLNNNMQILVSPSTERKRKQSKDVLQQGQNFQQKQQFFIKNNKSLKKETIQS